MLGDKIMINIYKGQFLINLMLKDEEEKYQLKKNKPESILANLSNSRPESWDWDNPMESKLKQIIMKINPQ